MAEKRVRECDESGFVRIDDCPSSIPNPHILWSRKRPRARHRRQGRGLIRRSISCDHVDEYSDLKSWIERRVNQGTFLYHGYWLIHGCKEFSSFTSPPCLLLIRIGTPFSTLLMPQKKSHPANSIQMGVIWQRCSLGNPFSHPTTCRRTATDDTNGDGLFDLEVSRSIRPAQSNLQ